MDVLKMLADLHQERAQVDSVILALERLAGGKGKRRGRAPDGLTAMKGLHPKRMGRPPGSKNKPKGESAA